MYKGLYMTDIACFQVYRISWKGIFFWHGLWDLGTRSWKEWCPLAQEYGLLAFDRLLIMEFCARILKAELSKSNIGMPGPF